MRTIRNVLAAAAAAIGGRSVGAPSRPARVRARLVLEALDGRLAPSSLLDEPPTGVGTAVTDLLAAPAAPQIVNFRAIEVTAGWYRFEGDVRDANPAGLTVTLGGMPDSLQGVTVVTDANGHFSIMVDLKMDGSDSGTAQAEAVNRAGVKSNTAFTLVDPR